MNQYIMQLKFNLSNAEHDYQENSIKVSRLIMEIQRFANPYFTNPDDIRAEELEQAGDELLATTKELRETQKKIKKLKEELGEG